MECLCSILSVAAMSFYLTLPSNSSLQQFSENKISHFITQLPSPIVLNGEWEVGLSEIIYPHTWYNVNKSNNTFGFDLGDGKLITRNIPPGCYETVSDILKAMYVPAHENKISFKFNSNSKRVIVRGKDKAKVVFPEGLCDLLGFKPMVVQGVEESSFVADPLAAFPVFYVYSDIVQPVVVGHVEAPLLRVVRIKGKDGEVVSAQYERPYYVPVIRKYFHTTEIELRLNSGSLVPFERGSHRCLAFSNDPNTINAYVGKMNSHLCWASKKCCIMKVPYVCCTKRFEDHYASHIGNGLPYYQGTSFQRGYGLGSFFRRIFRSALPFLVKGGQSVGKEALRTGSRVMSDVLSGENIKVSAMKRSKEAGKNIARKAVDRLQSMVGSGKYKRKRKKQKRIISSKKRKVRGRDIFDS